MAGSSARRARTVSTFFELSQRGIEASLCRHLSLGLGLGLVVF